MACASFALGGSVFTKFSRQISPLWMNVFKLFVGVICFLVASLIVKQGHLFIPTWKVFLLLFGSGLVGLFLGDLFLLMGFHKIGPARAMMLYAFQPVFVGIWSYFLFSQALSGKQMLAVLFLILCMFTMSYEQFRIGGSWEIRGLLYAVIGIILDGTGIVATRLAFEESSAMGSFEANFYRGVGAFVGFLIIKLRWKRGLFKEFRRLDKKEKWMVIGGSVLGTFISLAFWLQAISVGTLATVTALGGSTPLFASIFEHFFEKKRPTAYFYWAFLFFIAGFLLIAV